jgi:SH3-like domain-containing protein
VTTPTPPLPRYFVNTHALSLRDGPDSSAALITILDFKDEVELLDTSDGWGRVRDMQRDIVGWANMRYLQRSAVDGPRDVSKHWP